MKKREKKEREPKPPRAAEEKRPPTPKTRDMRRVAALRAVLWAAIGFVLLRGLVAILFPTDTAQKYDALQARLTVVDGRIATAGEVTAFAEGFVREYFTYTARGTEDYKRRLAGYCGERLAGEMCEGLMLKGGARATYTAAVETTAYSSTQQDVTVLVVTDYIIERPVQVEGKELLQQATVQDIAYILVPVYTAGGAYLVEDMPVVTAPPPLAGDYTVQGFTASTADERVTKQAETMLSDFFKTLYSEEQRRIEYYLSEDANRLRLREVKSQLKLSRLESVTVYNSAAAGTYTAIVTLRLEDSSGSTIKQRFNITLVENGSRMYVKDLNLRSHNLREG